MTDIQTEADVKRLVDAFYAKIRADALLDPIFSDVAKVDWAEHMPKMYAFWNGMLLGVPGYAGRPWPAHAVLPVTLAHFDRWVALFQATVDEFFAGETAERAKGIALSIAHTFALRMGLIQPLADRVL